MFAFPTTKGRVGEQTLTAAAYSPAVPALSAGDNVVLVAEDGTPIGELPRASAHTSATPLHLAFSCYVFNEAGEVLLTRRALSKRTWPGVWTNACCGHPRPGESMTDAVARRLIDELGIAVTGLRCVLPDFRYRAVDADGIVENELCPVFMGTVSNPKQPDTPNPDEVMEWRWVRWDDLVQAARLTPFVFSPWAVLQLRALAGR